MRQESRVPPRCAHPRARPGRTGTCPRARRARPWTPRVAGRRPCGRRARCRGPRGWLGCRGRDRGQAGCGVRSRQHGGGVTRAVLAAGQRMIVADVHDRRLLTHARRARSAPPGSGHQEAARSGSARRPAHPGRRCRPGEQLAAPLEEALGRTRTLLYSATGTSFSTPTGGPIQAGRSACSTCGLSRSRSTVACYQPTTTRPQPPRARERQGPATAARHPSPDATHRHEPTPCKSRQTCPPPRRPGKISSEAMLTLPGRRAVGDLGALCRL
jgi:hypothetical protein